MSLSEKLWRQSHRAEQIAFNVHEAQRPGADVKTHEKQIERHLRDAVEQDIDFAGWAEADASQRHAARAAARGVIRRQLVTPRIVAELRAASALATAEGRSFSEMDSTEQARYKFRAAAACRAYDRHLEEDGRVLTPEQEAEEAARWQQAMRQGRPMSEVLRAIDGGKR